MSEAIWVDVRREDEFVAGHIENSLHIPYDEIEMRASEMNASKDADIRVYCRSGNRSGIAKEILEKLGYTNVINEGGYEEIISR